VSAHILTVTDSTAAVTKTKTKTKDHTSEEMTVAVVDIADTVRLRTERMVLVQVTAGRKRIVGVDKGNLNPA